MQALQGAFDTDKLPHSPWMNSRIVAAFVSRILSMINLPRESVTATEIVAWWTSMPIYFSWLITALLSVGGDTNNHNLQQSGRLLYCVTWRFITHRDSDALLHGDPAFLLCLRRMLFSTGFRFSLSVSVSEARCRSDPVEKFPVIGPLMDPR